MSLLIETIKVIDGALQNLMYHNARLNRSRKELFNCNDYIDIDKSIKVPPEYAKGIYRCTITYEREITDQRFIEYSIKKISSLKLVEDELVEYSHKYADRSRINGLLDKKEDCDEIIIVKNGLVTDTSFTNIIFYDGAKWVTPLHPLLKGTKRQKLLDEREIEEAEISVNNLKRFSKACLINAMLDIEDVVVSCSRIY